MAARDYLACNCPRGAGATLDPSGEPSLSRSEPFARGAPWIGAAIGTTGTAGLVLVAVKGKKKIPIAIAVGVVGGLLGFTAGMIYGFAHMFDEG